MSKEISMKQKSLLIPRSFSLILFTAILLALYHSTTGELILFSRHSQIYDYIPVIPFISGYFLYIRRQAIKSVMTYSFLSGACLIATGAVVYVLGHCYGAALNQNDRLSWQVFSFLLSWLGGFALLYGWTGLRVSLFPLLFLSCMIPVPSSIMDRLIELLRTGSTDVAYNLLKLTGVSVAREGYQFFFPDMTVEVAEECSGIHSSVALCITCLVAGYIFFRALWRRGVLMLVVLPISLLRNGLRIAGLSLLGFYVDRSFVGGNILHKSGGIPLFVISLFFLVPVIWLLRERKGKKAEGSRDYLKSPE